MRLLSLRKHTSHWLLQSFGRNRPTSRFGVRPTLPRLRISKLTIPDYVLRLREHFKPGQPASDIAEYEHYLDLVGYWQDQCQKAQEECSRLRMVNIRLERSNQALSQQTNSNHDERPATPSAAVRRRAASPTRPTKRPKAQAEQTVSQTQEGIENDYEFLENLGAGE
jgi:hypothetical protein